jgi:NNP family nitrate/nitrite transporter-like MFS transporter
MFGDEHEKHPLGAEKQQDGAAALANQDALDAAPKHTSVSTTGPPPFRYSSVWSSPVINPLNLKSYTVPFFNLRSAYGRTLHLSWLGFFVAFTAWFSFSVLIHEAIKADLNLTQAEVANSNIIALLATLVVRLGIGPAVDRFGPRYVMCALLLIGAIPTGLSGTANSPGGIYAVRFFVSGSSSSAATRED